jgi:hypothetical protein
MEHRQQRWCSPATSARPAAASERRYVSLRHAAAARASLLPCGLCRPIRRAHAVVAARHQQEPATTPRRHQRNKKAAAGVSPRREESKGAPANKKAVTKLPLATRCC